MKFLVAISLFLGFAVAADTCTQDAQIKCVNDINNSYKICDKAAKEKGADLPADLECIKYLTTVEKDCWPCICVIAKAQHWKIKGCDSKYLRQ